MSDPKDKTASPPPAGKTLAKLHGGARIEAIVPSTLGECFALAEMVFKTGLSVPKDVDTAQKLTVVLMKGMELGLPPMAALDCIGLINGRACLYGDGIPSLLWSRGFKIREWYTGEDNLTTLVAHCEITRPEGDKYTFSYSTKDAQENGLWNPTERDHKRNQMPWQRYTKRMCKMRCRGWLARDCASDILKGIPIYEEQADIELGRGEYNEVKAAALAVPDDIPSEDEPAAATVSEAEDDQDGPIINPDFYIARLGDALETANTQEDFEETWSSHLESSDGRLSREHQQNAEALHEQHGKRFKKVEVSKKA